MAKLFANSGDPDQMPHSVASDLGMHCLPITGTLLRVSQLQWVNEDGCTWKENASHMTIFSLGATFKGKK